MTLAIRCPSCGKPVNPKIEMAFNGDVPYILCPWGHCQGKIWLPTPEDYKNHELHEWNKTTHAYPTCVVE